MIVRLICSREMELNAKSNQSQWNGRCRLQWPNFNINA